MRQSAGDVVLAEGTAGGAFDMSDNGRVPACLGTTGDVGTTVRDAAAGNFVDSPWRLADVLSAIPSVLIGIDTEARVQLWGAGAEATFGLDQAVVVGRQIPECSLSWNWDTIAAPFRECLATGKALSVEEVRYTRPNGQQGLLGLSLNPILDSSGRVVGCLLFGADVTARKEVQSKLAHAQKLEAIGLLAAGIAHEINTPTQFVGDNVRFLQDAFGDLLGVVQRFEDFLRVGSASPCCEEAANSVRRAVEEADLSYLSREIPRAIEQSLGGLERVAKIVRAMKEFSHPGAEDMTYVDLNRALESTVTISRNEWKYVAGVETDFAPDLPPVPCFPGDLNQVFLNIIVNAAHAIGDVVGDGSECKGLIRVSTRLDDGEVEVRISDTGTGIPPQIQQRVFDPFFTTKEVGKGTGQGLSLAHSIVTEKHRGRIWLESEVGQGTTFIVRLPLQQPTAREACA